MIHIKFAALGIEINSRQELVIDKTTEKTKEIAYDRSEPVRKKN